MLSAPEIVLVAAMGRNRVIGVDGRMPWHLPADLRRFKALTMGHPLVMGRRTFEAIGRALPGRRNIVVSRSWERAPEGVEHAASVEQALAAAGTGPVMVIGGGEIYAQTLPIADRMELTLVDAAPEGDARFPEWERGIWQVKATERRPPDDANRYALVFCSLSRIPSERSGSDESA